MFRISNMLKRTVNFQKIRTLLYLVCLKQICPLKSFCIEHLSTLCSLEQNSGNTNWSSNTSKLNFFISKEEVRARGKNLSEMLNNIRLQNVFPKNSNAQFLNCYENLYLFKCFSPYSTKGKS